MVPNEYFHLRKETWSQKYEINLYIKNGIQSAIKSLTVVNRHLTFVKMQQLLTFVFKIVLLLGMLQLLQIKLEASFLLTWNWN